MLRRYELTGQQWEQTAPFLPPEKTGKRGRPLKDNRIMLNAMIWIAWSGSPWRDLPEYYSPWESVLQPFSEMDQQRPVKQDIPFSGYGC